VVTINPEQRSFYLFLTAIPRLVVIPEELQFFKYVLYEKDKARAIREIRLQAVPDQPGTAGVVAGKTWFPEGYPEFDHLKFNRLFEKALQDSGSFKKGPHLSMVKNFR
jgi:hypothetical protein